MHVGEEADHVGADEPDEEVVLDVGGRGALDEQT